MFNPLNLIQQQQQAILRWAVNALGSYLVTQGIISAEQWGTAGPLLLTALGALLSLGSFAWSVHSNQAKVIADTANKLVKQGKVDPAEHFDAWGHTFDR